MKVAFDLEQAEFSDNSDQALQCPSSELIQMYNSDHSLVLEQAKKFFQDVKSTYHPQCKESISRFISLNNYGAGFNMPFILNKFMCMQNGLADRDKKQLEQWKGQKGKYEQNFYSLVNRMGTLIDQLLDLEIQVKRVYLGQQSQTKSSPKRGLNPYRARKSQNNNGSDTSRSYSIKKYILEEERREQAKEENVLRGILQKNMTPLAEAPEKVCHQGNDLNANLSKISLKIDKLGKNIKLSKEKQFRIWHIFNQKRPSKTPLDQETPEPEDKDIQKVNHLLNDLVSLRNAKLNARKDSIYQTPQ